MFSNSFSIFFFGFEHLIFVNWFSAMRLCKYFKLRFCCSFTAVYKEWKPKNVSKVTKFSGLKFQLLTDALFLFEISNLFSMSNWASFEQMDSKSTCVFAEKMCIGDSTTLNELLNYTRICTLTIQYNILNR